MLHLSLPILIQGLLLGASLIIAIGAQNAFVLRQGLKRHHVFITALICTLCDALLIIIGVAGFGSIIATFPALTAIATWGGAAFLFFYGFRSFRSALKPEALATTATSSPQESLHSSILTALALSLLNPHVYLDTVVLLGSYSAHFPVSRRSSFALGAMLASLAWFFSLAYGAAWLTPLFRRPIAWRVLDTAIGCIMCSIALSLILSAVSL